VFTEEGLRRAEELFRAMFLSQTDPVRTAGGSQCDGPEGDPELLRRMRLTRCFW
jgi:hypothetical protein